MKDCIFCRIIEGSTPVSMVYSDNTVMAFMDIQPVNPGHVLIIPKIHSARLSELDEETGAQMFKIAMRIAKGLRDSDIKCEGVNLSLADGRAAFQEVPHIHLHVIPRFRGDGFGLKFGSTYGLRPAREELDKIAEKITKLI